MKVLLFTRKVDIDVSEIAIAFGGKGHKEAASNPISSDVKEKIIKIIIEDRKGN